ncbi:MAG: TROVE domain-containing protein [Propionibacteriaceae bacterium]|nr:TROVE domain-containing protein [Propionibacteriaceae bacterium]
MANEDALARISTRHTPQTQQSRPNEVRNDAGGYVFQVDDMARLRRFLMIGVDGGTYYVKDTQLAADNAEVVIRLAKTNPIALVDEIVAVSTSGAAPKQNPVLFALAIAASEADEAGRAYALSKLSAVARTGTMLFTFAGYVKQFRSWGRGLRRAVGAWYTDKPVADVTYQAVKYRQRDGWTHGDLLRLAHPKTSDPDRAKLFDWILGKTGPDDAASLAETLPLVGVFEKMQALGAAGNVKGIGKLVAANPTVPWEAIPDVGLNSAEVWEALLAGGVPQTALMRQLPRLTRLGLATGRTGKRIVAQLQDEKRIVGGRIHPMQVLVALRTYASGRGARGRGEWTPNQHIVDALDAAFYTAYKAVTPTGQRVLLALDVSGSMSVPIGGMPISAREATAAMALVTANVEDDYTIVGFTDLKQTGTYAQAISELAISPRQRLDDVCSYMARLPFSGTDCALPMLWALDRKMPVDLFVVYTDSETWAGDIKPHQALRDYREKMGIPAKLVVVGTTSTGFTIADPNDAGMLDVCGFDPAVPNVITDFARGEI